MNNGNVPRQSAAPKPAPEHFEAIEEQVERLLASDEIKGSRILHGLLRFVVQAKLDGRDDEIKESVLATEVFGRKTDFDSRADPVARVHAHRLRKKLDQYYDGAGADDPWVIKIPTGSYVPEIVPAGRPEAAARPAPPIEAPRPSQPAPQAATAVVPARLGRVAWFAIGALVLALAASILMQARGDRSLPDSAVQRLWADMLGPDAAPTAIVFSETVFLSNDKLLLRYHGPYTGPTGAGVASPETVRPYVDPQILDLAGPLLFNRTYTALGQVYSVRALTLLFAQAGKNLALRPIRLLRPNEAATENLILSEDSDLSVVNQSLQHFRVVSGSFGYKSADQPAIEMIDPVEGEPSRFTIEFDEQTQERKVDYALAAMLPGKKPHLRVVLTDGITAAGSWAATQALTTEDGVLQLEALLGVSPPQFFEAVVRAEIDHDEVMSFRFVTARQRDGHPGSSENH